jgi:IS30 family transposase
MATQTLTRGDRRTQIVALRNEGHQSAREIAELTGVTQKTVYYHLNRHRDEEVQQKRQRRVEARQPARFVVDLMGQLDAEVARLEGEAHSIREARRRLVAS